MKLLLWGKNKMTVTVNVSFLSSKLQQLLRNPLAIVTNVTPLILMSLSKKYHYMFYFHRVDVNIKRKLKLTDHNVFQLKPLNHLNEKNL